MPIESEQAKIEIPEITQEVIGAEAHDDVVRDDTLNFEGEVQQEKDKKELLKEIEQKICNLKIGSHGMSLLMYTILKYGIDSEYGLGALNSLKSIFNHGVWSYQKQRIDQEGGPNKLGSKPWDGFGDRDTQNVSSAAAKDVFKAISEYLRKEDTKGINIKEVGYDDMINDDNFLDILRGIAGDRYEMKWQYDGKIGENIFDILESPRMKIVFKYFKSGNKDTISKLMKDSYSHFGLNLISAWSPEYTLKEYKEKGEIPSVDNLTILFKLPKRIHVHPMPKGPWMKKDEPSPEIGISNKISPKEFVAIAIDHNLDIEKIPKEFFDAIPKNLPIITSDLKKVIRMPEKND